MKVYLVWRSTWGALYEDDHVVGVFSTMEKAEEFIDEALDADKNDRSHKAHFALDEQELDAPFKP